MGRHRSRALADHRVHGTLIRRIDEGEAPDAGGRPIGRDQRGDDGIGRTQVFVAGEEFQTPIQVVGIWRGEGEVRPAGPHIYDRRR